MDQLRSQLAEILKDSVKHHMLSDVEVGAFLSGGVDSGYLASASGADSAAGHVKVEERFIENQLKGYILDVR